MQVDNLHWFEASDLRASISNHESLRSGLFDLKRPKKEKSVDKPNPPKTAPSKFFNAVLR